MYAIPASKVTGALGPLLLSAHEAFGETTVSVSAGQIVDTLTKLRDDPACQFEILIDLAGVDYPERAQRFEVVYHLLSFKNHHHVCLKVGLPEKNPAVPTLTDLWATANWQEREAYDLLGITFTGHPGLERILMPEDWEGHPLRKDVPLGGEEVAFTFNQDEIYAHKSFAKE